VVCLEYFACLLCSAPLFSKETQMVRLEELAVAAGRWEVVEAAVGRSEWLLFPLILPVVLLWNSSVLQRTSTELQRSRALRCNMCGYFSILLPYNFVYLR
jgi:hypothetical protein